MLVLVMGIVQHIGNNTSIFLNKMMFWGDGNWRGRRPEGRGVVGGGEIIKEVTYREKRLSVNQILIFLVYF